MTDPITRLRTEKLRGIYAHIDKQREEAADEIERLRAAAEQAKAALIYHV